MIATLTLARETPIACWLHARLIVPMATRLCAIRPGHVMATALLLVFIGLIGWWGGHDGIGALAMGAPDLASWFALADVATALEALSALALVLAASPLRTLGRGALTDRNPRRPRRTAPRARSRQRARSSAANDGEDDEDATRYAEAA
ncbi:hypothetical protein MTR62_11650 [Novosphingobium sp. 1949]|uniref:Uncharacterized protein n=1 Tax=Novosphingobium organovorum TaxID=2930092 RepID=A0ABT0BEA0_9SPHN|nr:hypothetical protein [Novosphingobium organovorum]